MLIRLWKPKTVENECNVIKGTKQSNTNEFLTSQVRRDYY